MIDVASRVKLVPLIRMKVFCYAPSKGRPLFQRRVSPFDPLRLSFDVRKHGFKAFEGARIGMLGLLDILATEKEETEPLPAPLWIRNKSRIMTLRLHDENARSFCAALLQGGRMRLQCIIIIKSTCCTFIFLNFKVGGSMC